MDIYDGIEMLKHLKKPIHLALGVFDGVHLGHQKVIQSAVNAAAETGGLVGVLTFSPHPIQVLAPERAPKRILASIQYKASLVEKLGCNFMVVQTFDMLLASQSAFTFLKRIEGSCDCLKTLSVGEDWEFGKGREGNVKTLKIWGEELGFKVLASPPVMKHGERVSSTRIRQAIRDGNLKAITEMLGRPFTVMGIVLEGRKLARQLGFPTANLKVYNEQLPPDGVWAVKIRFEGVWYSGVGNLGKRPTVEDSDQAQRLLEVHIFDFKKNLYGAELAVRFEKFIRPERKFCSVSDLKNQIQKDVNEVFKMNEEL